jgi:hypothetical protein
MIGAAKTDRGAVLCVDHDYAQVSQLEYARHDGVTLELNIISKVLQEPEELVGRSISD